jgi:lysozyme
MELSAAGFDLVKSFEGCRLAAYLDTSGIPTIGFGHTQGVKLGDTCTQDQADAWLIADLEFSEAAVNHLVTVDLEQHQFDPLVSFTYNLGQNAFGNSTLLRLLNAADYDAVPAQFLRWDKGPDGNPVPGLTRRREAEAAMFAGTAP